MPDLLTTITEIVTGLGTLAADVPAALNTRPSELRNVPNHVWEDLVHGYAADQHSAAFQAAFANGRALLEAQDGLRGRRPRLVEWKGPHLPPGDDVIPADLRIDHVYLVSCKYLSKIVLNAAPGRLFDRLLVGEARSTENWFSLTAPQEFQHFYQAARQFSGIAGLPDGPGALTTAQKSALREVLRPRVLPPPMRAPWAALCLQVSRTSADRWSASLSTPTKRLRFLWRLLRVSNATYFVLGSDRADHLRLRVASTWDWNQAFQLRSLVVEPRPAGQPEVAWRAIVRSRATLEQFDVVGHVEIRWSHGRFVGVPEAKVYLDTRHASVAGYEALR